MILPILASLLLALGAAGGADEPRPKRVGILASSEQDLVQFRDGLAEAGLAEGPDLVIEARLAEGRLERYGALARELAASPPTLIVAVGDVAAIAAKRYAGSTPVVFAGVSDPVDSGFVRSLERPGGTMTGVASSTPDAAVRLLELLKEAVPAVTRVAIAWNPGSPAKTLEVERVRAAAPGLGVEVFPIGVRRPSDFARVPQALAASRAEALVVLADPVLGYHGHVLGEMAAARRIPAAYQDPQGVDQGGLIAYGAPLGPQIRRTAFLVQGILGGTPPASLAVEPPPRFDLVVNLKTARALELPVPPALRRRADRVVRP